MELISFSDFLKIKMCVGTIVEAALNPKAKKPAYILSIDFGPELGVKLSSAQITAAHPDPGELIGTQVVAVMNFEPKRVAGVKSEVLVLAAVGSDGKNTLLTSTLSVENGTYIA